LKTVINDLFELTGHKPMSMHDLVKLHASDLTRNATH
jgi:hypothetical protein